MHRITDHSHGNVPRPLATLTSLQCNRASSRDPRTRRFSGQFPPQSVSRRKENCAGWKRGAVWEVACTRAGNDSPRAGNETNIQRRKPILDSRTLPPITRNTRRRAALSVGFNLPTRPSFSKARRTADDRGSLFPGEFDGEIANEFTGCNGSPLPVEISSRSRATSAS